MRFFRRIKSASVSAILMALVLSVLGAYLVGTGVRAGDAEPGIKIIQSSQDAPVLAKCKWYQFGCWFKVLKACVKCVFTDDEDACAKCQKMDPKATAK